MAGSLTEGFGHGAGVQGDTEPSPRDATVVQQNRHDALEGRGRNGDDALKWPERAHADKAAGHVEDRAAFFRAAEPKVQAQPLIDPPSGEAMPLASDRNPGAQARTHATGGVGPVARDQLA